MKNFMKKLLVLALSSTIFGPLITNQISGQIFTNTLSFTSLEAQQESAPNLENDRLQEVVLNITGMR